MWQHQHQGDPYSSALMAAPWMIPRLDSASQLVPRCRVLYMLGSQQAVYTVVNVLLHSGMVKTLTWHKGAAGLSAWLQNYRSPLMSHQGLCRCCWSWSLSTCARMMLFWA